MYQFGIILLTSVLMMIEFGCNTPSRNPASELQPQTSGLTGKLLEPGLYQLTGTHLRVGQTEPSIPELADPAPPYVNALGQVEVYGTGSYFIRYQDWADYSKGGPFEIVPIEFQSDNLGGSPWDLRKFRIEEIGKNPLEILLGGSMSPSPGNTVARWPEDNISRRIFIYRPNPVGVWNRDPSPLQGTPNSGWIDHSYGGNFLQAEREDTSSLQLSTKNDIYFFFEKVSEVNNGPYKTELFQKKITSFNDMTSTETPIKIMGVGDPPWPSTQRTIGGYLIEGPRPIRLKIDQKWFYIVGFSSGDYCTDSYTINYAWSQNITGPYTPFLNEDGKDLFDLGKKIKEKYQLSWVGRPAFYKTPDGDYEVLFHGVSKAILPDHDYARWPTANGYQLNQFFRNIYKAKLDAAVRADGSPQLQIHLAR